MKKEYKGYKYQLTKNGFMIIYPSGYKYLSNAQTEEEVLGLIDQIIAYLANS